jgi:Coenzyme F420 hydrogenase/dehydrogenase, beta subunit C terminus
MDICGRAHESAPVWRRLFLETSNLAWVGRCQDYRVHIKHTDGSFEYIPYFSLPANDLNDVIAPSCYSCFDYPNALADMVVGYMGVPYSGTDMTSHPQVVRCAPLPTACEGWHGTKCADGPRLLLPPARALGSCSFRLGLSKCPPPQKNKK